MENKPNLAKAILAVMNGVKGIDKNMQIGTGNSSYKGIADKDVKEIIGGEMKKNGLCILPIGIESKTQQDRWEEQSQYGNKTKQSVFTEVVTKYLLMHESGESIELAGYGHGVDSQDKGAGKATTYALKYTLLYTFLVPTGKIEDADNTHSEEYPTKPTAAQIYNNSLNDAIKKLSMCNSIDELTLLKETLDATIYTNVKFKDAAKIRFTQLS